MLQRSSQFISTLVLAFVFALTTIGSVANASRARLISLGQAAPGNVTTSNLTLGQGGTASLYIEDERSIFMNPAFLPKFAQFADFEFGVSNTGTNPNAEGGVFFSRGDLKYGIQLGRETSAASLIGLANFMMTAGAVTPNLQTPDGGVDLVVAGGGAMKWGAGVLFATSAKNSDNATATARYPNQKATTLELRGGVTQDKMQAFGKLLLLSSSETETAANTATNKYDGKPGLEAGVTFDTNADQKLWATFGWYTFSGRNVAQANTDRDGGVTYLTGGITQFMNTDSATRMFTSAGLGYMKNNLKGTGAVNEYNLERMFIPIVIGLESTLNDWAIVRASVRQNVLFDQTKNSNATDLNSPNTTIVAVGPGFKYKKFILDAVLAGSLTVGGNIDGNTLFSRAGLTYSF